MMASTKQQSDLHYELEVALLRTSTGASLLTLAYSNIMAIQERRAINTMVMKLVSLDQDRGLDDCLSHDPGAPSPRL